MCFVELKTYYYTLFGNTYCAFVKKSAIIFASNVLILLAGSNTEKRRNKLVTILWRYRISFDRRDLATIADFCVSMGLWHIGTDQCSNVEYEYTYIIIQIYFYIYLHAPLFFYEKWSNYNNNSRNCIVCKYIPSMYWKCCRQMGFLGKLNKVFLKVKIKYFSSWAGILNLG